MQHKYPYCDICPKVEKCSKQNVTTSRIFKLSAIRCFAAIYNLVVQSNLGRK